MNHVFLTARSSGGITRFGARASGESADNVVVDVAGTDAFTYTVTDALGASTTGDVLVNILASHPGGEGIAAVPTSLEHRTLSQVR